MEMPSIDAIARAGSLAPSQTGRGANATGAGGFAEALGKAIASVNEAQQRATVLAQRFQSNDPEVSLEEAMIASAAANVSFQALVQVRNRLLAAYREIMNLQV